MAIKTRKMKNMIATTHQMKLRAPYFEKMADGTKTIEVRLYDDKRRLIRLGDFIEFSQVDQENQKVKTEVVGLLRYKTFKGLVDDFPPETFGATDRMAFLATLASFYSSDDEANYGVLGICIARIRVI